MRAANYFFIEIGGQIAARRVCFCSLNVTFTRVELMNTTIASYWRKIQASLFPGFAEELGPTTARCDSDGTFFCSQVSSQYSDDPRADRPSQCGSRLAKDLRFRATQLRSMPEKSPQKKKQRRLGCRKNEVGRRRAKIGQSRQRQDLNDS